LEAGRKKEISYLAMASAVISNMLGIKLVDFVDEDIEPALIEIMAYLEKYSKVSENEPKDKRKPLLDLNKDAVMLIDAFSSIGYDLHNEDISYPRFMSLIRELPEKSTICRVIYLRQRWYHYDRKLTKDEMAECDRRGWDIIRIHDNIKKSFNEPWESW
jgi:hypothetical protein